VTKPAKKAKRQDRESDGNDSATTETFDAYWIVHNLPFSIFVLDGTGQKLRFSNANTAFLELFGLSFDALTAVSVSELQNFPFTEPLLEHCRIVTDQGSSVVFEWRDASGSNDRHLLCHLTPITATIGTTQLMGTITDRSAERQAERNMLHNALHDSLTGLANRILFQQRLENALIGREKEAGANCAVLIVNIDRFQLINESLGHLAGDNFLMAFASRLEEAVGGRETLARLSGDEFATLVSDFKSLDDVETVAHRIHDSLEAPFQLGNSEFYASATIGAATTLLSPAYSEELISDAVFAMHRGKTVGRGRTEIFQREKHQAARQQFILENDLRKALAAGQMELDYQPIVEIASGGICAFEALARWNHPERGRISPTEFIPIAEDTGIIVDIGRWALFEALRQLAIWRRDIPAAAGLAMSVNVAKAQLETKAIRSDLESALEAAGLAGSDVRLELTESAFYSDPQATIAILESLKETGVLISLDDFGTGYSSLGYLQNFPLDLIKVDRSFVAEIDEDNNNAKLVEIIAMLSKALEIPLVAEGVEQESQLAFLKNLGCEMGQGYLYSPPVDGTRAAELIKSGLLRDGHESAE
jgi:diguanylate cyclase (GGDEF)-like protein